MSTARTLERQMAWRRRAMLKVVMKGSGTKVMMTRSQSFNGEGKAEAEVTPLLPPRSFPVRRICRRGCTFRCACRIMGGLLRMR